MILPYLYLFLVFPVLVGILSVDVDGNRFSSLDYIKDRLDFLNKIIDDKPEELEQQEAEEGFLNSTNAFDTQAIELPEEVKSGIQKVWYYLWFLGSQSKELGVWIGTSSAPFHYVIAVVVAVFSLFINQIVWLFAFFYLLVTEWDEFKNIRKKDVI